MSVTLELMGSVEAQDDWLVFGLLQEAQQVVWFESHGGAVGHGVEIDALVSAVGQIAVQHHLHALVRVAEERERRHAALTHLQLLQQQRLVRQTQVSSAEAQALGHVAEVQLPVVPDGQQPQALLLLVFQEEVFSDRAAQMSHMRHHLLHREHLQQQHNRFRAASQKINVYIIRPYSHAYQITACAIIQFINHTYDKSQNYDIPEM